MWFSHSWLVLVTFPWDVTAPGERNSMCTGTEAGTAGESGENGLAQLEHEGGKGEA